MLKVQLPPFSKLLLRCMRPPRTERAEWGLRKWWVLDTSTLLVFFVSVFSDSTKRMDPNNYKRNKYKLCSSMAAVNQSDQPNSVSLHGFRELDHSVRRAESNRQNRFFKRNLDNNSSNTFLSKLSSYCLCRRYLRTAFQ